MKIAIGCDHAGVEQKNKLITYIESLGHQAINCGTDTNDSVDYPDFANKVAISVSNSETDLGIILCGSGIGVSITANKVKGIRAALCYNEETSKLCKQHNNANILCYGARFIGIELAKKMVFNFLNTEFEGGRHQNRINKIHNLTSC
jgi:ribose 5-phosphate isomerase B